MESVRRITKTKERLQPLLYGDEAARICQPIDPKARISFVRPADSLRATSGLFGKLKDAIAECFLGCQGAAKPIGYDRERNGSH